MLAQPIVHRAASALSARGESVGYYDSAECKACASSRLFSLDSQSKLKSREDASLPLAHKPAFHCCTTYMSRKKCTH